jgi:hypothetical protein
MKENGILAKQNYMRERIGAPKSKVLTFKSPVDNPKSGHDYSIFVTK